MATAGLGIRTGANAAIRRLLLLLLDSAQGGLQVPIAGLSTRTPPPPPPADDGGLQVPIAGLTSFSSTNYYTSVKRDLLMPKEGSKFQLPG